MALLDYIGLIGGAAFVIDSKPPKREVSTKVLCLRCNSENLTKFKGCVLCLDCHYKADCNGW